MNFAQLNAFGVPSQVVDSIEGDEPGAPGTGEVLVEMLACPINPAELLIIEGRYASKPALPGGVLDHPSAGLQRHHAGQHQLGSCRVDLEHGQLGHVPASALRLPGGCWHWAKL